MQVKQSLFEIVMKCFKEAKSPMVLREIYEYCGKVAQWNPRSIRKCVEETVLTGYVKMIKCQCGHSHLYILATKSKMIAKQDHTIK